MMLLHPKFAVRRLMVAVAIAALIASVAHWLQNLQKLSKDFRQRGAEHNINEESMRNQSETWKRFVASGERRTRVLEADGRTSESKNARWMIGVSQSRSMHYSAKSEYYARLAKKYERAARYPWLPVASDPPEPK